MDVEIWRWIWLASAVAFVIGELLTAGSLFLLPFGVGAGAAAVLAFLDASVGTQWVAFLLISIATFAALRPVARRLEAQTPLQSGVGASRWVGKIGVVLADIPAGRTSSGTIRVDREEWRAESAEGTTIPVGTTVKVIDVTGTRLVVAVVNEED